MNIAAEEEIVSINAIFGESTVHLVGDYAVLQLPRDDLAIKIRFPDDYPISALQVEGPEATGSHATKGRAHELVQYVKYLIKRDFVTGQPCIYDLLVELTSVDSADTHPGAHTLPVEVDETAREASLQEMDEAQYQTSERASAPEWALSEVIAEKRSVFVARAVQLSCQGDAKRHVAHLVASDKKVAKATHNITAWRFRDELFSNVVYQDCDDDGESAAGSRLLHLLELMGIWNCLVVVSRWYGGIHLGPDRFRIINSAARDALVKGGFVAQAKQIR